MNPWLDISTAPKKIKEWILLGYFPDYMEGKCQGGKPKIGFWDGEHWFSEGRKLRSEGPFSPTHWMPIPEFNNEEDETMSYEQTYELTKKIKLKIHKTPKADTRSCDYANVTRQELAEASQRHLEAVEKGMSFFSNLLMMHNLNHDFDKIEDLDGFHENFVEGFSEGHMDWLGRHYLKNRHHLENPDAWPEDVNLIDVLDHIVDQVMSSKARDFARPVDLPGQLLQLAVGNTVKLLADRVEVIEDE